MKRPYPTDADVRRHIERHIELCDECWDNKPCQQRADLERALATVEKKAKS